MAPGGQFSARPGHLFHSLSLEGNSAMNALGAALPPKSSKSKRLTLKPAKSNLARRHSASPLASPAAWAACLLACSAVISGAWLSARAVAAPADQPNQQATAEEKAAALEKD